MDLDGRHALRRVCRVRAGAFRRPQGPVRLCRESRSARRGCPSLRRRPSVGYGGAMRARRTARRWRGWSGEPAPRSTRRRSPLALLPPRPLVSLSATIELLRQDPAFEHAGAGRDRRRRVLAVTLPLALRRRYPLTDRRRGDRRLRRRPGRAVSPERAAACRGRAPSPCGPAGSRCTPPSPYRRGPRATTLRRGGARRRPLSPRWCARSSSSTAARSATCR